MGVTAPRPVTNTLVVPFVPRAATTCDVPPPPPRRPRPPFAVPCDVASPLGKKVLSLGHCQYPTPASTSSSNHQIHPQREGGCGGLLRASAGPWDGRSKGCGSKPGATSSAVGVT